MTILILIPLIMTAAICLAFNQRLSTRLLGIVTALIMLTDALFLLLIPAETLPFTFSALSWATLDIIPATILPTLNPLDTILVVTLLGGGTLSSFALAIALDSSVRGFGSLFSFMLLTIAAAILGLMSTGALVPLAWGLTVLAAYSAVRSSGALAQYADPPHGVTLGLLASLFLLVGMLIVYASPQGMLLSSWLAMLLLLGGCLILASSVPFHSIFNELVKAPSALGGLFYGVVLPVLALGTMLRIVWYTDTLFQPFVITLPSFWRMPLLWLGLLNMVVCAAGAIREHSLRRLLAWQVGVQVGVVLLAVCCDQSSALVITSVLIINIAFTTMAGALATAVFEHVTGSDDYTQELNDAPGIAIALRVPGLVWGISALSALGLPPLWGFWGRYWLIETLLLQAPMALPILLGASGMAAFAYLMPLARLWLPRTVHRVARQQERRRSKRVTGTGKLITQDSGAKQQSTGMRVYDASTAAAETDALRMPQYLSPFTYMFIPIFVALPLIIPGIAPQYILKFLMSAFPREVVSLPVSAMLQVFNIVVLVIGMVVILLLWMRPWKRRMIADEDMVPVVLPPDALAESLTPLSWIGFPSSLADGFWYVLDLLNRGVQLALAPFEERYYLAGVLLALVSLIVVMAQL